MIEKAYRKDALSKAQVLRWHKTFKEGREEVEDKQRSGRPSTAHTSDNVDKVKAILNSDRRLSVRLIADKAELPKSIVHEIITTELHMEVLKRLGNKVARVRPEIADDWILHHDNAPSHGSMLVKESLAKHKVQMLPQPLYSPELAPADFFLFPRLKSRLKGHHFGTVENVQAAVTSVLKEMNVQEFQASFQAWQNRWKRCIDAQGSYFEDF